MELQDPTAIRRKGDNQSARALTTNPMAISMALMRHTVSIMHLPAVLQVSVARRYLKHPDSSFETTAEPQMAIIRTSQDIAHRYRGCKDRTPCLTSSLKTASFLIQLLRANFANLLNIMIPHPGTLFRLSDQQPPIARDREHPKSIKPLQSLNSLQLPPTKSHSTSLTTQVRRPTMSCIWIRPSARRPRVSHPSRNLHTTIFMTITTASLNKLMAVLDNQDRNTALVLEWRMAINLADWTLLHRRDIRLVSHDSRKVDRCPGKHPNREASMPQKPTRIVHISKQRTNPTAVMRHLAQLIPVDHQKVTQTMVTAKHKSILRVVAVCHKDLASCAWIQT